MLIEVRIMVTIEKDMDEDEVLGSLLDWWKYFIS